MQGNQLFGYVAAILAGFTFGMIPVISALMRNLGISSLEQVFFRIMYAFFFSIIVLFYLFMKNRDRFIKSLCWDFQKSFLLQGFFMTLMVISYLSSVALHTPVGEAALLTQIHPFLTLMLGYLFLKEQITKPKLFSLGVAILGVLVITAPWQWDSFLSSIMGDVLAMSNGFFYALYLVVGRKKSEARESLGSLLSISWVLFWAFIVGFPMIVLLSMFQINPLITTLRYTVLLEPKAAFFGFLLALTGSFIPYGLLMITAKTVESSKTSILVLGEPVGAILFGNLLLHEPITWNYLGGSFLLGIAIALTVNPKEKHLQ